ncbi:MAG TPA: hypothetical protein VEX41_08120 [Candidatus Eisenbacteria bacterium]|nr:hypothetical protein [Candidatus Eisenbacteria bacterium]
MAGRFVQLAVLGLALVVALVLAACGAATSPTQSASAPAASGARPSSPAVVAIEEPKSGAMIDGDSVHIVLSLTRATIVSATTTDIRPDTGHIHLYVNNVLVSMNYGLEQDIPVHPGTYVVRAEFVAADHAPFNRRVWTPEVFFTVK